VLSEVRNTVIFYEAPHRIRETLEEAAAILGKRQIVVARELTKLHQEFVRGTSAEVLEQMGNPRGELTVVLGPADIPSDTPAVDITDQELAEEFGLITDCGELSRREAVAALARKYARPAREVYAAIERSKNLG
jgi:16S rRNA (cytidine1402-2'-O)-methyltransferase